MNQEEKRRQLLKLIENSRNPAAALHNAFKDRMCNLIEMAIVDFVEYSLCCENITYGELRVWIEDFVDNSFLEYGDTDE